MKAQIKPLSGKYYGTIIIIDFQDGGHTEEIKLWDAGDWEPSCRELEKYNMTLEQWNEEDMSCDGHFESKLTYDRAFRLISLINIYEHRNTK